MKWFFQIGFLCVILGTGLYFLGSTIPCKQVLTYSLGEIDQRFNLTGDEIIELLARAEEPWESYAGRDLFRYDQDESDIVVNFIYDERQERTQASLKLEKLGEATNEKQLVLNETYESLKAKYQASTSEYEKNVRKYELALAQYNQEVTRLNRQGGANEDDISRLKKEERALQEEAGRLEAERLAVNTLAYKLNTLAKNEAQVVKSFNEEVNAYEEKYQNSGIFDQGDFGGRNLNIYQFRTTEDLTLVLAHELGHTLGLDHVENSESLMYYLMEGQSKKKVTLTPEDKEAFDQFCKTPAGFYVGNIEETVTFLQKRFLQTWNSYE